MQPYAAEWLSIVPPIVAIGLALITKEVFSSLLVGIFTGTLIYACGTGANIVMGTTEFAFKMMAEKLDFNILIFCSLLGALIYVITMAGGTHAYGKAATRLIKGRRSTLTATSGLGIAIFIDDYFNCLTVGTVMRPLTDLYRISREKLAYIIDSTAAPICIIAPISSWAAAVGSSLKSTGAFESELGAFVSTIPWNFYALLSLVLVGFICTTNFDFGPMRRAELRAQKGELSDEAATVERKEPPSNPRGTVWDMLVPLAALIICAVLALMYSGGYWGEDAKYHTFMAAIGNSSASISLVWASFSAIVVALLMFVPRRLVTFSEFMNGAVEGELWDVGDVPARLGLCDCGVPFFLDGDGLGDVRDSDSDRGAHRAGFGSAADGRGAFGDVGGLGFRGSLFAHFGYDDSVVGRESLPPY